MIGALSRLAPRFAGSVFSGLKGIMPKTAGEAAFSFLPDIGFAAMGAAMAPGAAPEIGFTGTSPLERAGIFGYELFANGVAPSLTGRVLGKGAGRLFRAKNDGPYMGAGEMALQMTTPYLIPNPVTSGVYERYQAAQESAQAEANKRMIEAELRRRSREGSDIPPAANGIRPMSATPGLGDAGYDPQESALRRQLQALLADTSMAVY